MSRARGEVITFYSFKGGVGRSMAVANVATLLAQRGKKVLVLDFDFEAPGLHRYFLSEPDIEPRIPTPRFSPDRQQKGVIDLFEQLRRRLRAEVPVDADPTEPATRALHRDIVSRVLRSKAYRYRVQLRNPNGDGGTAAIDFIAAGRFDERYAERIRAFNWKQFYGRHAEVLPTLADHLARAYDYVLIDSRTGFTDVGSLCTIVLPDKLVLVFAPNEQSLAGALDVGEQAIRERRAESGRPPLLVFPLLSRLEDTEERDKRRWIKRASESFGSLLREAYETSATDIESYFEQVRIHHRGYYAYGERIAAEEEKAGVAQSMAESFRTFTDRLCPEAPPRHLIANAGKCSGGTMLLGMGFVLSAEEARALVERDDKNREVVHPYLNGEDVNTRPDQTPARFVVNFRDWPLSSASRFPDALQLLETRVKPERLSKPARVAHVPWWQFVQPRQRLYDAIRELRRVVVRARLGKYNALAFVDARAVFSEQVIVFVFDDFGSFATLQSFAHDEWSARFAPSLGMRAVPRYVPGDCFETFPFPPLGASLESIGERYHEHRRSSMLERREGLTRIYNRFHDRGDRSVDIQRLRDLHVEMDGAVARAYGWDDLQLNHGFHVVSHEPRFTIGAAARSEILDRLLQLNDQRYADEAAEGLHESCCEEDAGKSLGDVRH